MIKKIIGWFILFLMVSTLVTVCAIDIGIKKALLCMGAAILIMGLGALAWHLILDD